MNGCFFCYPRVQLSIPEATEKLQEMKRKGRDEEITAYALAVIALVLFILCCVLFTFANLSPEFTMGFSFIPYLMGGFAASIGGIILLGALIYFVIASVHNCQAIVIQSELR